MQSVHLKYGSGQVRLNIPESSIRLQFQEPDHRINRDTFRQKLGELLTDEKLEGKIAVVVADKTRLCGYREILPWLVDELQERGADSSEITFYIAYGTHPRQSDEECEDAYGEVYSEYRFVHHDCHDGSAFIKLGETSNQTPVLVRRELCEATLVLTIGAVSHHYFAGYGGGRKLIFPGLGERNAVYANHRLFLDTASGCLAKGCQPGNLTANPLAADLWEVHQLLPSYLSIHGILDSRGGLAQLFFGRTYDDFLHVCKKLDECYKVDTQDRFDMVVASTGGFPKDINFIQTHKSVHHAAGLVKDGGTLIVLAECRDSIGSKTFLPYFEMGGWEGAFAQLTAAYAGNGGTALAMMEKTKRIQIKLVTSLDEQVCSKIGVEKISVTMANELIERTEGILGLIENSSLLIGSVAGNQAV